MYGSQKVLPWTDGPGSRAWAWIGSPRHPVHLSHLGSHCLSWGSLVTSLPCPECPICCIWVFRTTDSLHCRDPFHPLAWSFIRQTGRVCIGSIWVSQSEPPLHLAPGRWLSLLCCASGAFLCRTPGVNSQALPRSVCFGTSHVRGLLGLISFISL